MVCKLYFNKAVKKLFIAYLKFKLSGHSVFLLADSAIPAVARGSCLSTAEPRSEELRVCLLAARGAVGGGRRAPGRRGPSAGGRLGGATALPRVCRCWVG